MDAITNLLEKFGSETVNIIRTNITNAGQNASGQTSEEIKSEIINDNRVQVSAPSYVYTLETGRKPGKQPALSPIKKWIETGKPNIQSSIDSAAWAIAKSIAKNGTLLFQQGGRKDIITPIFNPSRFQRLENEIADLALNKMVSQIKTQDK